MLLALLVCSSQLVSVTQRPHAIDVVYKGAWSEPVAASGVTLVSAEDDRAVIAMSSGRRTVRKGDWLGKKTRVLWVLDDLVLLEQKGKLAYLALGPKPVFRMTWEAAFVLPRPRRQPIYYYGRG